MGQFAAAQKAKQDAEAAEAERLRTRSFDTRSQNAATYTHGAPPADEEEGSMRSLLGGGRRRAASREILG